MLGTLNIKGRNITVYEGTSDSVLLLGAGHFAGTSAWNGNVALAGHNRGPNAWFSDLINLRPGDPITYMTSAGFRPYTVTGTKIVSVEEFQINMTQRLNQEVSLMCNLSKGIEDKGIQKGIQRGKVLGAIDMCRDMKLLDNEILKRIMEKFSLTEEEARGYMAEAESE